MPLNTRYVYDLLYFFLPRSRRPLLRNAAPNTCSPSLTMLLEIFLHTKHIIPIFQINWNP